jgi:FOG: TPR repeat
MYQENKIGFPAILALVFLLPIFFLPTQIVPLGLAKVILITLVAIGGLALVIVNVLKEKRISIPETKVLWASAILPLVYIVSSLFSASPVLSVFGYALEIGTAGSVLLFSILFFLFAYMFRDRARLVKALTALFVSLSIVAVFVLIKILSGGNLFVFDTFFGNIGNPVGAWTDLAVVMGLLSLLTIFAVEMLPLGKNIQRLTKALFVLALVLLSIINFSSAWVIVLGAGVVLLTYFATIEKSEEFLFRKRAGVRMTFVLMLVALVFVFNPTIGSKDVATRVMEVTGVVNSDVRPNLKSTFDVSKDVLSKSLILGSGPNTFDKSWLAYKPSDTNATPFWNIAFPFGFGFLPTAVSSVGLLGTLVWLAFFVLYITLGVKALATNQENRSDRFILTSTLLTSLFLWGASFMYTPSLVLLSLAFITSGLFVGAAVSTGVIASRDIILNQTRIRSFVSYMTIAVLVVGMGFFGFVSTKKILAGTHFQRALVYANAGGRTLDEIEGELGKAIITSPSDPYWGAVSQIELNRANGALNNTSASDEENQQTFQNALSASISAIQSAIALNPTYQNWVALGNIYASLVPEPFSVDGAYDSAKSAYQSAGLLHPISPEVPLLIARLEFDSGDVDRARDFVAEALSKKSDYAEAYFFLSQIEVSENNLRQAIESAETGTLLLPNNPGVHFQLGLLKYSNRDYDGAQSAFARALALVPDYANAKYYLGLTLDKLDETSEAIKIFEELLKANPGNTDVENVLTNLKAGRSAMVGASEEDSKTLPISGQ